MWRCENHHQKPFNCQETCRNVHKFFRSWNWFQIADEIELTTWKCVKFLHKKTQNLPESCKKFRLFFHRSVAVFSFGQLIKDFFHHTRKETRRKYFSLLRWSTIERKSKFNSYENDFHVGVCKGTYTQDFSWITHENIFVFYKSEQTQLLKRTFNSNQFFSLSFFHWLFRDVSNFLFLGLNSNQDQIKSSWKLKSHLSKTGELISTQVNPESIKINPSLHPPLLLAWKLRNLITRRDFYF